MKNIFNQKNRCMKLELLAWSCTPSYVTEVLWVIIWIANLTWKEVCSNHWPFIHSSWKKKRIWVEGWASKGRDKVKQIIYGSPVLYYTLIRRYHPRYAKWPIVPRGPLCPGGPYTLIVLAQNLGQILRINVFLINLWV